jgi:hypothetical protein
MTYTTTEKLITQLRTLQQLTNTEAQVAQTRQVQARDEAVREELATNAANGQERAQLIAAAVRDLGGVPDVVTPALGRATALAKTVVEQGQPIAGALFGDLALEHQLLDRAGYLEALADTADHADTRNLARRLQAAHQETIDWITSVLVEEASGEPTKVRPTPVQKAVGRLTSVVILPARRSAEWINGAAEAVARARSRVGTVAEAAVDSLTAGRDAALLQAEQIATRKGSGPTRTPLCWIQPIAALEHCSELTAAHSGRSVVLVQRGFQAIGPVAVSGSRHAKLGGQLARETVTRNG